MWGNMEVMGVGQGEYGVGGAGWGVCRVYIVLVCGSRRCWVGCVQGVYSAGVW